jgi:polyhydroxyalkanoate synthesis regulator phasin
MKETLKKGIVLGIGIASLTKDKALTGLKPLVKKGKIKMQDARKIASELTAKAKVQKKKLNSMISSETKKEIKRLGLVSRAEARNMINKIKTLEKKLKAANKPKQEAPKKKTAKKKAKKKSKNK